MYLHNEDQYSLLFNHNPTLNYITIKTIYYEDENGILKYFHDAVNIQIKITLNAFTQDSLHYYAPLHTNDKYICTNLNFIYLKCNA